MIISIVLILFIVFVYVIIVLFVMDGNVIGSEIDRNVC